MLTLKQLRELRKISQVDLANKVGVLPQQINNIENGSRNAGNKMLPLLSKALNVSPAYLRGQPENLPVRDFANGDVLIFGIVSATEIAHYGIFYLVADLEDNLLSVIMSEGVQFTPADWQGKMLLSKDEIGDVKWVDYRGRDAVMVDNLPRIFT